MRKRVHGRIPPAPRESRRCARLARRGGTGEIPARRRWGPRTAPGAQLPRPQGVWVRVGAGLCRGAPSMARPVPPPGPAVRRGHRVLGAKSPVPQPCPRPTPWGFRLQPGSLGGAADVGGAGGEAAGPPRPP